MTDLDDLFVEVSRPEKTRQKIKYFPRRLKYKIEASKNNLRARIERATRGWAHSDVWSLNDHIASTLGPQLVYLSGIVHGWPGDSYGTFEQYQYDMMFAGQALCRYSKIWELYNWDIDIHEQIEIEREMRADVKLAMMWVAENFTSLWD